MFPSIDLQQVRILTRYALTSEWRKASTRSAGRRRKMSRAWAYWSMVLYLMIGAFGIRIFIANNTGEVYVTAMSLYMLYGAFVIASNIFMSFGSGFLSPDEAQIISLLPVSSETFFFSRLAVLICYTSIISVLLSIGPFVGLEFFLRGGTISLLLQNITFVFVMVLSGITASMAVIVLYGIMMKTLGQARVGKVLGFVQFAGSFVTAMSFIVLSQVRERIDLHTITLATQPWIAIIPAYWFASLAALSSGITSGLGVSLAVAALVLLAVLAAASHILLGKHYQTEVEELSASSTMSSKEKKSHGDSLVYRIYNKFARSDEARAVFAVLRAQFRYDSKFRMQLLATLPITFLYLLIAIMQGGITDPFTGNFRGVIRANMFYVIAMLMPLISMQAISQSENYKAAWLFFSSPIDRSKLLFAVRNAILVTIIIPYMIVFTAILSYYMPVYHAIAHALVIAAIAGMIFQCYMMINPKMPFAQQRRPNRGGFAMAAGIAILVLFAMGLFALVLFYGYRDQSRFWPIFALIVTISAALEFVVHARIRKKLEREEFDG